MSHDPIPEPSVWVPQDPGLDPSWYHVTCPFRFVPTRHWRVKLWLSCGWVVAELWRSCGCALFIRPSLHLTLLRLVILSRVRCHLAADTHVHRPNRALVGVWQTRHLTVSLTPWLTCSLTHLTLLLGSARIGSDVSRDLFGDVGAGLVSGEGCDICIWAASPSLWNWRRCRGSFGLFYSKQLVCHIWAQRRFCIQALFVNFPSSEGQKVGRSEGRKLFRLFSSQWLQNAQKTTEWRLTRPVTPMTPVSNLQLVHSSQNRLQNCPPGLDRLIVTWPRQSTRNGVRLHSTQLGRIRVGFWGIVFTLLFFAHSLVVVLWLSNAQIHCVPLAHILFAY